MSIIEVKSHDQLLKELIGEERVYLLLYKSGSESSECALRSLKLASQKVDDIKLLYTDVTKVRDIHSEYNIKSAPALLYFENSNYKSEVKGCNSDDFYTNLIQQKLFKLEQNKKKVKQKPVTVYTTPTCPHCTTLKHHLQTHNINFTEIDVSKDQSAAQRMVQKSGQQGVPQADIGGEFIIGFNKQRINKLLNIN